MSSLDKSSAPSQGNVQQQATCKDQQGKRHNVQGKQATDKPAGGLLVWSVSLGRSGGRATGGDPASRARLPHAFVAAASAGMPEHHAKLRGRSSRMGEIHSAAGG
jgi:hypothetical protein